MPTYEFKGARLELAGFGYLAIFQKTKISYQIEILTMVCTKLYLQYFCKTIVMIEKLSF